MKHLLLVRHGETDWNRAGRFQGHTDTLLNEQGRAQARALGERLRDRRISGVAASDLRRARETADIVAALLGVPLVAVDHELRERSYGAFEGLTRDEIATRFPEAWAQHQSGAIAQPPGAEPREQVIERVVRAVRRCVVEHGREGEALLVVTHGGAMRAFLEATIGHHVPPIANTMVYELTFDGIAFAEPPLD